MVWEGQRDVGMFSSKTLDHPSSLVEFSSATDAQNAINELNGTTLDGREIYVRQVIHLIFAPITLHNQKDDSTLAKNDKK